MGMESYYLYSAVTSALVRGMAMMMMVMMPASTRMPVTVLRLGMGIARVEPVPVSTASSRSWGESVAMRNVDSESASRGEAIKHRR